MFFINLKIALRNLKKNKGFSLMNIGGLAIGMTCCLLLLLYVSYEWGYDKQFKDIDRIFFTRLNIDINGKLATTIATPDKLAGTALQTLPGVEQASRMDLGHRDNKLFSHNHENYKLSAPFVDPSFLRIFEHKFIYGDALTALSTPNSVLITASAARKLFGHQNPLGQSIKYDNRKMLKVTAVIEDLPENQSLRYDALLSWAFFQQEFPESKNNSWGSITCATYIKLKDKSQFAAVDAGLRKMIRANEKDAQLEAFLFPYARYHLYNEFVNGKSVGGRIDQVKLFAFLAFCVLLIASINYMNLSTARSEKRAREVGVRKALGSTRKSLMGQFMIESMLFSLIAVIIAFGLLELSLPYFNNLLGIQMKIDYSSYTFWLTLSIMVLLTGFLAGSYPAFYLSSFTPIKVLKGITGIGQASLPVRKILVVLQFSLSICMIICAIIIYTQIQFMQNKPLGFSKDNLVEMSLEGEWRKPERLELFKTELKKSGAVISATEFAQYFTQEGSITGNLNWPGKPANDNSIIDFRSIGYDFSATIGAEIVKGRDLSRKFPTDTAAAILVNEAMVKTMRLKSPVGTVVRWGEDAPLTIVGVIKNYSNENVGGKTLPTFFYYNVRKSNVLIIRINPDENLTAAISKIKQISQNLNPAYPAELTFVSQDLKNKLKSEQLLSVLSNFFGGFAIFISCLGLLGLALYMAEQRKKEISIRKVLGADLQSILILLNKDFIKLVMISNLIAFPVAFIFANNWLKSYDYKISIAAWPFIIAAIMSLGIALLTVSLQSFKVAKANAVDALKYE
ncbi:ABC-type antimicrobial peptide transport system permease subunit [Pedobacter cryoconitis]|uniref:ABC-type antimicrobial peptide transport system permease subunit n=1 Tax=Pedobacter cryoconitis TaxID=188932 RepID=A0A7W8ZQQ5_9SPHI|nr:ABC transporter permease [Pedobacter cryoconitis]MBB5638265.1 ABC-type antimicrobial peptide transport system permease subunit [Pedobacter cryoconitis]